MQVSEQVHNLAIARANATIPIEILNMVPHFVLYGTFYPNTTLKLTTGTSYSIDRIGRWHKLVQRG